MKQSIGHPATPRSPFAQRFPTEVDGADRLLRVLLGPDDWLGRHEGVCLAILAVLYIISCAF